METQKTSLLNHIQDFFAENHEWMLHGSLTFCLLSISAWFLTHL